MKHIEVVAAIIQDGEKILATQRGYGELAGGWEFPGGKIEPGESREDALVRELREELAVKIDIERFIATVEYAYDSFYLTMHCYLAHLAPGEQITLLEHSAAQWVDAAGAANVAWLPADIQLVDLLREQGIL